MNAAEAAAPQPAEVTSRQPLMKVKDVAVMLNVETMTVYNLTQKGELKSLKLGTMRRYRIEDVEAYLQSSYSAPKPEQSEGVAVADG
jgi:excisionase family DNA binding protein